MCTCITYKNGDFYFGRNMDIEYDFGEKLVMTPRNHIFRFKEMPEIKTHHAMIGMAAVHDGYPLYAEAVNEKGLCMAGLYFPGNAFYNEKKECGLNLAPYELIPWILGQCSTVKEASAMLEEVNITDEPFDDGLPLADLHWMIADESSCIVLEAMKDGNHIYDNIYGVLTNNPPFPYYQIHLSNYINIRPEAPVNSFSKSLELPVYGQGMGALGLPGDFSPVSRFVKAAFLKWNSHAQEDEISSVTQFFHILDAVAMVDGAVVTENGLNDVTLYSCCINVQKCVYYFKTYGNSRIQAVDMKKEGLDGEDLRIFEVSFRQDINFLKS